MGGDILVIIVIINPFFFFFLLLQLLQRFRLEYHHEPLEMYQKLFAVPDKPVKIKFVDRLWLAASWYTCMCTIMHVFVVNVFIETITIIL